GGGGLSRGRRQNIAWGVRDWLVFDLPVARARGYWDTLAVRELGGVEKAMTRLVLVPTLQEAEVLMGRGATQVLRRSAGRACPVRMGERPVWGAVGGLGLAAAGVGAYHAVAGLAGRAAVDGLLLVGIAGGYGEGVGSVVM